MKTAYIVLLSIFLFWLGPVVNAQHQHHPPTQQEPPTTVVKKPVPKKTVSKPKKVTTQKKPVNPVIKDTTPVTQHQHPDSLHEQQFLEIKDSSMDMHHEHIQQPVLQHDTIPKNDSPVHQHDHDMMNREQNMNIDEMEHSCYEPCISLNLPMNRNGSGTGWNPDESPMYMWMRSTEK